MQLRSSAALAEKLIAATCAGFFFTFSSAAVNHGTSPAEHQPQRSGPATPLATRFRLALRNISRK
jgi:hypothetical protein